MGARELFLLKYMAEFRLDNEELVGARHQKGTMVTDFQVDDSTNNDMLLVQEWVKALTVSPV